MSVQLILYPQGYNGVYNQFSNPATNFIVNGNNFSGLATTPTATGSSLPLTILQNPATVPNAWYRFKYGPSSLYPFQLNGNCVIPSDSGTVSGVYQRMTGLTFGVVYELIIDIILPPQPNYDGNIIIYTFITGQTQTQTFPLNVTTSQVTATISASMANQPGLTDMTIFVGYIENSTSSHNCTIGRIQVQPAFGASGSVLLDDGQVICDLYEDEDLPLTLSVDEFKNVAEKVQSYSKAFNLPATKRNNRIFDQVFEITRHTDVGSPLFNPYQTTQCVLKQDGLILFKGYLRLLDITDKDGEISYNVNLFSDTIALADYLKDFDFSNLDFTELAHDYDKENIKSSWNDSPNSSIGYLNSNTSGFRDDYTTLRYPFVDWNHQMVIANNQGATGPTLGNTQLLNLEQAFRPFINIKYIIERIFQDSPFTFTSDFFDTTEFKKLYMDFNWGADNAPFTFDFSLERGNAQQDITPIDTNITLLFNEVINIPLFLEGLGYDDATGIFTAVNDNQIYNVDMNLLFTRIAGAASVTVEIIKNGLVHSSIINYAISSGAGNYLTFNTTLVLQTGDTWFVRARKISGGNMRFSDSLGSTSLIVSTSGNETTSGTLLQTLRGEIGQWDFLKGLITMFNLVTLPDDKNPNNIIIEPYVDVFVNSQSSVQLNWTDKIDISEMKLTPLTDLNRNTIFKFVEDDDDFAFTNYKNLVGGHLYGSKKYNSGNEFNILIGTKEIVAEPFAATLVKPLMSQFPQLIIPSLYSMNNDGTSEGFDNSPRIMFNNGIKPTGTSYYIPEQNGYASENQSNYLQFSHLSDIPVTTGSSDFHFGECQLLTSPTANPTNNNLFNTYWLPYMNELYNTNTRIMTIKVDLSPADISTFKFNDTVIIKNREFRCNRIDYKPNDLSTVEFILIP